MSRLPFMMRFQREGEQWALRRTELEPSTADVLLSQCELAERSLDCPGIANPDPWSESNDLTRVQGLDRFVRLHRRDEHEAYLAAVWANDRAALKSMNGNWIPPTWLQEAILQVARADLPLSEKRKRMAWLFHDHALLAKALSGSVVDELRPWLPLEDWWPVLKVIEADPSAWRHQIVSPGRDDESPSKVDCALQHAQGFLCEEPGDTW